MNRKSELIEISGVMDTSADYFPFYEFAVNYIQGMKNKGNNSALDFIETIRKLGNNSGIRNNHYAFGKLSKSPSVMIKTWCLDIVCKNKELENLTLDELHYVMGYCARRAKISEAK